MQKIRYYIHRIKQNWGIQSRTQFLVIMLVFSITGFSILFVKAWLFAILGIGSDLSLGWRILLFAGLTLPLYQVILLFYGFVFGQFKFFWAFEKRMLGRLCTLFSGQK